jgi:ABC-2 type transport system ATP-binding protein
MPSILVVQNLFKKYGDFEAVKGISFDIQEGEIFSLLGPNGAGKTTTISMLSTLYEPTSGDATVAGHSVTREPMAVRNVIGVVPQEIALYEDLTARENLVFWGQMYGLSGKALEARVDEVLEQIGLTESDQDLFRRHEAPRQHRRGIAAQAAPALHG